MTGVRTEEYRTLIALLDECQQKILNDPELLELSQQSARGCGK